MTRRRAPGLRRRTTSPGSARAGLRSSVASRALLSALGISIGIAAIVGVLGISQSSKASLLAQLGELGNL